MQMEFQATEAGKRLVATLDFALMLKDYLVGQCRDGAPQDEVRAAAASLIAWAITGHDVNRPPQSGEELIALANFIQTHAAIVNAASDACVEKLAKHDSGPAVH
jgi:hypothetical protein